MAPEQRWNTPRFGVTPGVWLRADSPLTPTERLVLTVIAMHAAREPGSKDSREARPSQSRIAAETQLTRQTVNGAIHTLVEKGALQIVGRHEHNISIYRVVGYDCDQTQALPWTGPVVNLSDSPVSATTTEGVGQVSVARNLANDLRDSAVSVPDTNSNYEQREHRAHAPAGSRAREGLFASRNGNRRTGTAAAKADLGPDEQQISCAEIASIGQSWRERVGPKTTPNADVPPAAIERIRSPLEIPPA